MDAAEVAASSSPLHCRNFIATSVLIPTKHISFPTEKPTHSSCIFPNGSASSFPSTPPSLDLELISLKSSLSYTSIKDLLPSSAVNSPTSASAAAGSGYEISIRNRLVKQAAWAYLQPNISSSPGSSGPHFLRRLWHRLSSSSPRNLVSSCFRFLKLHLIPGIARFFDRILRSIRIPMMRRYYE